MAIDIQAATKMNVLCKPLKYISHKGVHRDSRGFRDLSQVMQLTTWKAGAGIQVLNLVSTTVHHHVKITLLLWKETAIQVFLWCSTQWYRTVILARTYESVVLNRAFPQEKDTHSGTCTVHHPLATHVCPGVPSLWSQIGPAVLCGCLTQCSCRLPLLTLLSAMSSPFLPSRHWPPQII